MAFWRALVRLLEDPRARGLKPHHPATARVHRRLLDEKRFLRRVYDDWYRRLSAAVPEGPGAVLELGSGAGFLDDLVPGLVTSEVFLVPWVAAVVNGQRLPFATGSLRAIVMVDVLHHLPECRLFFAEAARAVRPGGTLAMIEPWVSPWSRFVFGRVRSEPFEPEAESWELPPGGRPGAANGALPWIVFERDRRRFEHEFPRWRIERVEPFMPIRYVLSGGLSKRRLMPGFTHGLWRGLEESIPTLRRRLAMFVEVVLVRTAEPG